MRSLIIGAVLIATPVSAAPFYLGYADEAALKAIDLGTIRRSGDTATVWITLFFPKPLNFAGQSSQEMMVQVRYDCAAATEQNIYATVYKPDGTVLRSMVPPGGASPVVPGSIGEGSFNAVCDPKSRKPERMTTTFEQMKAVYAGSMSAKQARPSQRFSEEGQHR